MTSAVNHKWRALVPAVAAVLLGALLAYAIARPPPIAATYLDFDAFYCGAQILAQGHDPYRYEPLHTCETHNLTPAVPNAVVPVPLPPYAIAAFVPLARLAYPRAQFIWWLLLIAAGLAIVWVLAEMTGFSLAFLGAPVLISMVLPSLTVGNLAIVPIALLLLSALAMRRARWTAAAALQTIACVEPHVALPVMLAAGVFVPQMRLRLALGVAAIAALSLAAGHVSLNAEFIAAVAPAHAISEIANAEQYGSSAMLRAAGLTDRTATLVANLQYAAFVLAGLWLVRTLRTRMPESIVFVPMALAVTGGPFIHVTQIAAAIPLALCVARHSSGWVAWTALAAIAIAIPWQASIGYGGIAAAVVLFSILARARVPLVAAGFAAVAAAAVLEFLQRPELHRPPIAAIPAVAASALAEVPWSRLAAQFPPTAFSWYGHALIYAGFACLYWSLGGLVRAINDA